jgi:hypothetical protein
MRAVLECIIKYGTPARESGSSTSYWGPARGAYKDVDAKIHELVTLQHLAWIRRTPQNGCTTILLHGVMC